MPKIKHVLNFIIIATLVINIILEAKKYFPGNINFKNLNVILQFFSKKALNFYFLDDV